MQLRSSDALTRYYREVEGTSMLSAERERELICIYQEKQCPRARDLIIKGALRYVIAEARKHPRSFSERTILEDLIAAGNIGLIRALNKFDISAGTRFLTYASWWVRHEIREESRRLGLVHVPAHALARGTRPPMTSELTENSVADVVSYLQTPSLALETAQSLIYLFESTQLTTREIFIIKTSFGIHTGQKTLKQIGRLLELTGERVRQLRETAIFKLRGAAAEC